MVLVITAVNPSFVSVFVHVLCIFTTGWINGIHECNVAVLFVFGIMKPRLGSFCKWVIRWLLKHNQCYWLSSELIYPHPHCLFGSVVRLMAWLAFPSLRYTLVIFHTADDTQHHISISSFLCYFLVASQAHCFSSCSCCVIVQRPPVAHVHLVTFTSFSWLPHLSLSLKWFSISLSFYILYMIIKMGCVAFYD